MGVKNANMAATVEVLVLLIGPPPPTPEVHKHQPVQRKNTSKLHVLVIKFCLKSFDFRLILLDLTSVMS